MKGLLHFAYRLWHTARILVRPLGELSKHPPKGPLRALLVPALGPEAQLAPLGISNVQETQGTPAFLPLQDKAISSASRPSASRH